MGLHVKKGLLEKIVNEHRLKTWPEFFKAINEKNKTFEIRKNDRNFQWGDILVLEEYDPERNVYTGRKLRFKVGYMIQGICGLPDDICCMSLLREGGN